MRKFFWAVLALLVLLAAGCDMLSSNGLPDPAATMAAEHMPLEPEAVSELRQSYTLYFLCADRTMLAGELRMLTVEQPGRIEDALLDALLKGPGSSQMLQTAINPATKLVNVTESRDNLYVTFSREFLEPVLPEFDEAVSPEKREEQRAAALQLAAYSVVNTVTELGRYTRVQILIDTDGSGEGSRPTRAVMGFSRAEDPDGAQLLNPLSRNMGMVYGPASAAERLLTALVEQDWQRMEASIALSDPQTGLVRESRESMLSQLIVRNASIMGYGVGDVSYAPDGKTALVLVDVQMASKASGVTDIPLRFLREDGVWKLTFNSLELLLNHVD